jgi:hypothetical protein
MDTWDMKYLLSFASITYGGYNSGAVTMERLGDLAECLAALAEKPNTIIELVGARKQIIRGGMTKPPRLKE